MTDSDHTPEKVYSSLGEYLVCFQGLESEIREIGWLLLNPGRTSWPPQGLRNLTNNNLLGRVQALHANCVGGLSGPAAGDYVASFEFLIDKAHDARRVRNTLLHSAFVELKGGNEVFGLVRVNPRLDATDDGEPIVDSELLTTQGISKRIVDLGRLLVAVGMHHKQLIHWSPFDASVRLDECGLAFHRTGLPFPPREE